MKRFFSMALALLLLVGTLVPLALFAHAEAVEISNYGGYSTILRVKGDKSLLFSPTLTEVQTAVSGGAALSDFSIEMTFTLLSGNSGTPVFTFPKATAALVKSNGSYYDVFLNGSKGDCGFCPTAGSYYNIYVEVFKSGELFCYGTYANLQAPAAFANSTYYNPTPVEQPITLPYPGTSNYTYNGIRKKSSGQILFSPYIYELRELIVAGDSYSNYSAKLTFSLVENGEVTATWDPVTADFLSGNGYYSDIILQASGVDCGFCPTAGATYNVYVEVYKGDLELFYGTYENVLAASAIADSAYYAPSAIPSESFQLSETVAGYTGQIYPTNAFAADNSGVYFTAFMTEFRTAVDGGENVADYTASLKITKVKNGTTIVSFPTILGAGIEDAGTYFKVVLKNADVSLFCPEIGKTYTVELELLKNGRKIYYGTYTNATAGNDLSSSSYYEPVTGAVEIASRTGYGGGIRQKSNGSILFSPFVAELRALISAGHAYSEYTTILTPSLVENGAVTATWNPVTISLGSSNGQYFDAILQGASVDCGFCPTAGSVYNFYIEIYWQGELFFYGTYENLTAASAISGSSYYRPSPVPGAPIEYNALISYTFSNTLRGSAAGFIDVLTDGTGYFEVKWLDANGDALTVTAGTKTLTYSPLATFVRLEGGAEEWTHTVLSFTAIPQGAAKVGVCDSNGTVAASYDLPSSKLLTPEAYTYSFGVASDIHYNYFYHEQGVDDAVKALNEALSFFEDAGAVMLTAVGDYSKYAEEASYQAYAAALANSNLLVLACGGNHELYADTETMFGANGYWRTYMNPGVYDATPIAGVKNVAPNGIDFVYEIPGHTDSVFIFLSQWYWDSHTAAQQHLVTPEQIEWLEDQFETYADRTVFFYFHTYLYDDDGETFDGEGDLTGPAGYTYNAGYNMATPDEAQLRGLLTEYKNVIFFNGHSHYLYEMQKYNPNLNIYDYEGTTATMIHVPSLTNPRLVTDTSSSSYSSTNGTRSQAALMFVYNGYEIMNGLNVWDDEILAEACYIIYNDKTDIIETQTSGGVTMTYDEQTQTLRFEGEGEIPQALVTAAQAHASVVKNLYVGRGITAIPASAFSGFTALKRAEIKETVLTVGENAFAGCTALSAFVYGGSSADLASMTVASGNTELTGAATSFDQYVVTFVVDGVSTVTQFRHYVSPVFDGKPGKVSADGQQIYVFTGWNDGTTTYNNGTTLPKATKNVTYTAVFGDAVARYVYGDPLPGNANITWTLDRYTGTLSLVGTGAIDDFARHNNTENTNHAPWYEYAAEISKVTIGNGITKVGTFSFADLPALSEVVCGKNVATLNADSFSYCPALKRICFHGPLSFVDQGTVYSSGNLEEVGLVGQTATAFLNVATRYAYNDAYSSASFTTHVLQSDPSTPASCTETGLTVGEHCATCGWVTVEQAVVPANGHTFTEPGTVTKYATFTETGTKDCVCSVCGETVECEIASPTLGLHDSVVISESAGVTTAAIIGTITGTDFDYDSLDRVQMHLIFKKDGAQVNEKTISFGHLLSTVKGVASINEATAAAGSLEYVEADGLFAVVIRGIPAGDYTVEAELAALVAGEPIATFTVDPIDFTVA